MEKKLQERKYMLNAFCIGYAAMTDNCWNFSIICRHPFLVLLNEYYAGFIQGKLQGVDMIKAARNNTWKNSFLCDTGHTFPKQLPPTTELERASGLLTVNYNHTIKWIEGNRLDPLKGRCAMAIERLFFRLWGVFDGLTLEHYRDLDKVKKDVYTPQQGMKLGYGDDEVTFGDLYFINTQMDLMDVAASSLESTYGLTKPDHCSAFAKRTLGGDIVWTHNSWCGFLSQSHTISYVIGDENPEFITQNSYCFGQVGSNMDFGFNGHGICFNETTHRYSYNKPTAEGVWLCWRSAAAEMFAQSIDDFYEYLSADNTGTYLNGYMVIDARKKEMALIEMSYKRFGMLKSGQDGSLTGMFSTGEEFDMNLDYDNHLMTGEYILGVNYPVIKKIAYDLASTDNRPMRRVQFFNMIGKVKNVEDAKELITYISDDEPLSICGRWDIGTGTTEYPKTIPDGAVDAKAFSAYKVCELLDSLTFTSCEQGGRVSFWMRYGVAPFKGENFVWSKSQWAEYKDDPEKDFVPDDVSGAWNQTKLYMK